VRRPFLLVLAFAATSYADRIVLVSGAALSGEVVEETAAEVTIRMARGSMKIARARIGAIEREEAGTYRKREAAESLRAGLAARAVQLLEEALRGDPADTEAKTALIGALRARAKECGDAAQFADARAALGRLLELVPDDAAAHDALDTVVREEEGGARAVAAASAAAEDANFDFALATLHAWRRRSRAEDSRVREALGDVHASAGAHALAEGEHRAALDHFRAAAAYGERRRSGEGVAALRPIAALEAIAEGDLEGARRFVDAMESYPDRAVPVFLRALVAQASGRIEDAVRDYAEASRLAESGGASGAVVAFDEVRRRAAASLRAAIAVPGDDGARRFRETFLDPLRRSDDAEFFVVYAPTDAAAKEAGAAADAAYRRAAQELLGGVPAAPKAELVIHADRAVYLAADPRPEPGIVSSREGTCGVTYDTWTAPASPVTRIEAYAGDGGLLADTIPHEAAHVVQRRGLPAFRRGHWLDEGLATTFESERSRSARRARFARSVPAPLPEFVAMQSTPPEAGVEFYDQAHALVEHLRARGDDEEWRRFLSMFATRPFAECLAEVYAAGSVDAFERAFLDRGGR